MQETTEKEFNIPDAFFISLVILAMIAITWIFYIVITHTYSPKSQTTITPTASLSPTNP